MSDFHRRFIVLDFIDKWFVEKEYEKAREAEKKLNPKQFVGYYTPFKIVYLTGYAVISLLLGMILQYFEVKIAFIPYICVGGLLVLIFFYATYRCYVDEDGITSVYLGVLKHCVCWEKVYIAESVTINRWVKGYERKVHLKDSKNKILFSLSYDLVGFQLILEKLNERKIEVKRRYRLC